MLRSGDWRVTAVSLRDANVVLRIGDGTNDSVTVLGATESVLAADILLADGTEIVFENQKRRPVSGCSLSLLLRRFGIGGVQRAEGKREMWGGAMSNEGLSAMEWTREHLRDALDPENYREADGKKRYLLIREEVVEKDGRELFTIQELLLVRAVADLIVQYVPDFLEKTPAAVMATLREAIKGKNEWLDTGLERLAGQLRG